MNNKLVSGAAAATVLAGAMALASGSALADEAKMEKCFGVVKAGMNDCQANGHSCQGHASKSADKGEWVLVPAGLCEKLDGGSLKAGM
ncbi:signal peptidase [Hahella sp. CCB-MM4]|uniref:BufA1 family periplasmic bufferin-type metallophore n=1 Tax=Hahella sp. (strain CCB-MM4) TaxID=1926491 RepID=UPI000B9B5362|nr:DUF2282 domain-containing protein [Hahella sp. CCB-MM4]OZG70182.1 signal peptidase [Hahella sp. CCB-MM4]